jgi:release factor glutamine methyltransferase
LSYPKKRKRMVNLLAKKVEPLLQILYKSYSKRKHDYNYYGLQIAVPPGIFNPQLSFSTKYLLRFLSKQNLAGYKFLEVGAGSGVISLLAAKSGAFVTSVDVNPLAVTCTRKNAEANQLVINVILSDAFESIPVALFDIIVVNPPYYPKSPKNDSEKAWFCGVNFYFFRIFFSKLEAYSGVKTLIYMVLSEDCDIGEIKRIASSKGFSMEVKDEKRIYWEVNYIFLIQSINAN